MMSHGGPKDEIPESYSLLQVNNLLSLLLPGTVMQFNQPGLLRLSAASRIVDEIKKEILRCLQRQHSIEKLTQKIHTRITKNKKLKDVSTAQFNLAWGHIYKACFQKGNILDLSNAEVKQALTQFIASINETLLDYNRTLYAIEKIDDLARAQIKISDKEINKVNEHFMTFLFALDNLKQFDSIKAIHHFLYLAKKILQAQQQLDETIRIESFAMTISPSLQEGLGLTCELSPVLSLELGAKEAETKAQMRDGTLMVCLAGAILHSDRFDAAYDIKNEASKEYRKESKFFLQRLTKRPSKERGIKEKQPSLSTLESTQTREQLIQDLQKRLTIPPSAESYPLPPFSARNVPKSPKPTHRCRAEGAPFSDSEIHVNGKTPPPKSGHPLKFSPRDEVDHNIQARQLTTSATAAPAAEDEQTLASTKLKSPRRSAGSSDSE